MADIEKYDRLTPIQTASADSGTFTVKSSDDKVSVCIPELQGTEKGNLQFSADGGTTWSNTFKNGVRLYVAIGAGLGESNPLVLDAPGVYRVQKPTTIASTAVYIKKGNF